MGNDDFRAAGSIAIIDPTGSITVEARRQGVGGEVLCNVW
jgi:ribosomal protein S8